MIQKHYKFKSLSPQKVSRLIRTKRHSELLDWVKQNCPTGWFKLSKMKDGVWQEVSTVDDKKSWNRFGGLISVIAVQEYLERKDYSVTVGKFLRFGSTTARNEYSKSKENQVIADHIGNDTFEVLEVNTLNHVTTIKLSDGSIYAPKVSIIMPSELRFFRQVFTLDEKKVANAVSLYAETFGEKVIKTDLDTILKHYDIREKEREKLRVEKAQLEYKHAEYIRIKQELRTKMCEIDQNFISLNEEIAKVNNQLRKLK